MEPKPLIPTVKRYNSLEASRELKTHFHDTFSLTFQSLWHLICGIIPQLNNCILVGGTNWCNAAISASLIISPVIKSNIWSPKWGTRYHHGSALGVGLFFTSCLSRIRVEMRLKSRWRPRTAWTLGVSVCTTPHQSVRVIKKSRQDISRNAVTGWI